MIVDDKRGGFRSYAPIERRPNHENSIEWKKVVATKRKWMKTLYEHTHTHMYNLTHSLTHRRIASKAQSHSHTIHNFFLDNFRTSIFSSYPMSMVLDCFPCVGNAAHRSGTMWNLHWAFWGRFDDVKLNWAAMDSYTVHAHKLTNTKITAFSRELSDVWMLHSEKMANFQSKRTVPSRPLDRPRRRRTLENRLRQDSNRLHARPKFTNKGHHWNSRTRHVRLRSILSAIKQSFGLAKSLNFEIFNYRHYKRIMGWKLN